MTVNAWRKLPALTDHDLIIVDEMHDHVFQRLLHTLHQLDTPVWLINREIPPADDLITAYFADRADRAHAAKAP